MILQTDRLVDRRHPQWLRNEVRWRWLADSMEGGLQYREAVYGVDRNGRPLRNLTRYKQEIPERGQLEHPDYALRLERTPVPSFVAEAIETHLAKIYSKEVLRQTSDARLEQWWSDVNGTSLSIDEWLSETVAPLLLVLGQLDLAFVRPRDRSGSRSAEEDRRLGLDRCIASIVLPENVVWWRLDPDMPGRYEEVLIREESLDEIGRPRVRYRHWTETSWELLDEHGKRLDGAEHPFGRVPVVRVFDRINPRREHVGISRYEPIAELQREAYNRESELILAGARMNLLILQAPDDYLQNDSSIPIGPGNILPKKKATAGSTVHYEGWDFLDPPQGPTDSLREDLVRLRDQVDRAARLTKPAGTKGSGGSTVSQSGVSKALDQDTGNALLGQLARSLQKAEWEASEFALCVIQGGDTTPVQRDAIRIVYPANFSLLSAEETAGLITEFQGIASVSGEIPEVEAKQLKALNRLILPGQDDQGFAEDDEAIDLFMGRRAQRLTEAAEGAINVLAAEAQSSEERV